MWTNLGMLRLRANGAYLRSGQGASWFTAKHLNGTKLAHGRLIAFRISSQSLWGSAGDIVLGRIMAVPTDALSIDERQYLINGRAGPQVTTTGEFKPVLEVPPAPGNLRVPDNCYFVCRTTPCKATTAACCPGRGKEDIVATDLFLLGGRGFGRALE